MITPGSYKLNFDFQHLKNLVYRDKEDSKSVKKIRKSGTFIKPSKELKLICENIISSVDDSLEWYFEIFFSTSPVKLHNDFNLNNRSLCRRVAIIPIDYNGNNIPSTIVFDKQYSEKIVAGHNPGEFINLDKQNIDLNIDKNISYIDDLYYEKKLCHMQKPAYNGLKIIEEYDWILKEFFVIDSSNLHASSFFDQSEWKISINGLGFERI